MAAQEPPPQEAYPLRVEQLQTPPLAEVASALAAALSEDYRESSVDVVDCCPDLTGFGLCQRGLGSPGGRSVITDHGGEAFNHDPRYNSVVRFDMRRVGAALGMPDASVIGAGACAATEIAGHWGELAVAAELAEGGSNSSVSARVDAATKLCVAAPYPSLLHGGICNLHLSDGMPGPTLRVRAKGRIGAEPSLPQTLRRGLNAAFPGDAVGLGGTFRVLQGKVRAHVQPDCDCCPPDYYSIERMCCTKDFLQFYEGDTACGPGLTMLSVLWSKDPTGASGEMNLRPSGEHTHFFCTRPGAEQSEAGHYHGDDPSASAAAAAAAGARGVAAAAGGGGGEGLGCEDEIEYEGYFVLAREVARVRDAVAEEMERREQQQQ
jgi:hypothetical protein